MSIQILVVDDHEAHRYAMGKILQNAGYEVILAKDGEEALDLASQHAPQVVLLDINMPGINGYQVCRQIKSDERTKHAAVIFHTGTEATSIARSQAESVGASAFLTYPISTDHLLSVVEGAAARFRK
ncbi:MAG TPA: response regulator [Terriglobales bacterium]|nr:response regulator [Terriglobales bacterium]